MSPAVRQWRLGCRSAPDGAVVTCADVAVYRARVGHAPLRSAHLGKRSADLRPAIVQHQVKLGRTVRIPCGGPLISEVYEPVGWPVLERNTRNTARSLQS